MNYSSTTLIDETRSMSEVENTDDKYLPSILSITSIPLIKVRIFNYRPVTKIKLLKSNIYNQFVSVVGTVTRVSVSKPYVTRLAFECGKCSTKFVNIFLVFRYFFKKFYFCVSTASCLKRRQIRESRTVCRQVLQREILSGFAKTFHDKGD